MRSIVSELVAVESVAATVPGRPPAQALPALAGAGADQARRQGGHLPQGGQPRQGHQAS